jgi:hypothetical protein
VNGELKGELKSLQERAVELEKSVRVRDTLVVRLRDTVKIATTRVITVDAKEQPKSDSALIWLRQNLTEEANAKLAQVTESYEQRLAVRDKLIEDQRAVIAAQEQSIATRDSLIVTYRQEIKSLKHGSKLKSLASILMVAVPILVVKIL